MNHRTWLRLGAKTVHDIASIGFGGALAACLVINLTSNPAATAEFLAARHVLAAIAKYILVPAMAVMTLSGLLAGSAGNLGEIAATPAAGQLLSLCIGCGSIGQHGAAWGSCGWRKVDGRAAGPWMELAVGDDVGWDRSLPDVAVGEINA